ncbi:MAG: serine/threonine protein phosphatase [Cyanobacteria bacterium K_DeepCast_35m_m2_023]|nr:serine/threonine protein phosphatase [Cyanobacteria bacterium K_DeepCast_35m_m2_023]
MTPTTPTQRHWVIGDVHGCAESLRDLVDRLPSADRLVLCGDVINRGPRIAETMQLAWDLVQSGRCTWLLGNHEADLVEALRRGPWQLQHGLAGCDTYRQLGDRSCRAWLERLQSLPLAYWGQGWVATHAGFDPLSWKPHLSIRVPFWQAYDGRFGTVIVGHTPGSHVRRLDQIVLIDTGACYGGELSAYCPETAEVAQVAGLRPWGAATAPLLPSNPLPSR